MVSKLLWMCLTICVKTEAEVHYVKLGNLKTKTLIEFPR